MRVKTLAHEIIDYHRGQFQRALAKQFGDAVAAAAGECGEDPDPADEATAARLAAQLFSGRARIVRPERYAEMRERLGSFTEVALAYYWSESARVRAVSPPTPYRPPQPREEGRHRELTEPAKASGTSTGCRRRWSTRCCWHRARASLKTGFSSQTSWTSGGNATGVALLIDAGWEAEYRRSFRALGSPDALNEANQRRFSEILSSRGRIQELG